MVTRVLGSLGVLAVTSAAFAQGSSKTVSVTGIAYDSLHQRPLSGAFVGLAGTGKTAVAGANGTFRFDSVAPGSYRLVMHYGRKSTCGVLVIHMRR